MINKDNHKFSRHIKLKPPIFCNIRPHANSIFDSHYVQPAHRLQNHLHLNMRLKKYGMEKSGFSFVKLVWQKLAQGLVDLSQVQNMASSYVPQRLSVVNYMPLPVFVDHLNISHVRHLIIFVGVL